MTKKLQRKSYTEAFRREAVQLSEQPGRNATEVARELGIHPGQIYNWRTQFNKLSKRQFTVADGNVKLTGHSGNGFAAPVHRATWGKLKTLYR